MSMLPVESALRNSQRKLDVDRELFKQGQHNQFSPLMVHKHLRRQRQGH